MDDQNTQVETTETEEESLSLTKEAAKSFALGAAITAGTVAGFAAAGFVMQKLSERKAARQAKKDAETTPTEN